MLKTVTVRIYIKAEEQISAFYWVTLGKDNSIYFGSSLSKKSNKGFCGINSIENGVMQFNHGKTRPLTREEINSKFSLHNSGTFILPQQDEETRIRSYTIRLPNYNKAIPLAGIIPKKLSEYPKTNKKIKKSDLLIDATDLINQPFSITLYVKESHHAEPIEIYPKEEFDCLKFYIVPLGQLELGAVVYANTQTFNNWPTLEYTCVPDPDIATKELPWVVHEKF